MVPTPWTQTFGMQTKYGVPKPSYRALQLLSGFPKLGLPVTATGASPVRPGAPAAAAAAATVGNVDVITGVDLSIANMPKLAALVTNYNVNTVDAEDPTKGLPIATETGVVVTFQGLPSTAVLPVNATVTLLDSTHGWAKPVWIANGSPTYPTAGQVQEEMDASQLVPFGVPLSVSAGTGGTVTVSVSLPPLEPYAVALVTVQYSTGAAAV